ncbi:MAG: hypothetical protein HUU38_16130, partial [Anaerolineales bacterium]|nr:hypothetical protein [Anaerolineales bacterium]
MNITGDKKITSQAEVSDYIQLLARLSFGATIIFIPFRYRTVLFARPLPPIYRDFTDFLLFASDFFMLATLLFWGIRVLLTRKRIQTGPFFLTYPLLAVLLVAGVSVAGSVDRALSLYHFVRLVFLAGLYLYIINEVRSLKEVAIPILVQTLIQSWVGVAQTLAQHSLGLYS